MVNPIDPLFAELDSREELFLLSIGEPEDNVLRLIISEAGLIEVDTPDAAGPHSHYSFVAAFEGAATYEVTFADYVAYALRNESFVVVDKGEEWEGRLFCVYRKSKFLDFVRSGTIASDEHPGLITHYGINCANHIVDVACVGPPEIRKIGHPAAG